MVDVRKELQILALKVKAEIIRRLRSHIGINWRAKPPHNTLEGSNLEESIDLHVSDEDEIIFKIADYYSFVAGGRNRGVTPDNGKLLKALSDWITRKHIKFGELTHNQMVYLMVKHLKNRDISGRKFIEPDYDYSKYMDEVIPFLDDYFETWADDLFLRLTDEIKL